MDSDEGGREPAAGAHDRVRAALARLGADADSASDVPAEVTARIGAALRAAPPPEPATRRPEPAHALRGPLRRGRRILLFAGIGAAVLGVALGAVMLTQRPTPAPSAPDRSADMTAHHITVSRPAAAIPLPDAALRALLTATPDFGPLTDPRRRAGCLRALGQPDAEAVLGARPLDLGGNPAVLLLVPGATPETMVAVAVSPRCGPDNAAVLTERRAVRR